jgi:hypothetical protein
VLFFILFFPVCNRPWIIIENNLRYSHMIFTCFARYCKGFFAVTDCCTGSCIYVCTVVHLYVHMVVWMVVQLYICEYIHVYSCMYCCTYICTSVQLYSKKRTVYMSFSCSILYCLRLSSTTSTIFWLVCTQWILSQ